MKEKTVVFMDTKNKIIDESYANEIISEFRKQTGWKVEKGTRIYNELREFSKCYSKIKREPIEVITIFILTKNI